MHVMSIPKHDGALTTTASAKVGSSRAATDGGGPSVPTKDGAWGGITRGPEANLLRQKMQVCLYPFEHPALRRYITRGNEYK